MKSTHPLTAALVDPALPAVAALLADPVPEPLEAAVAVAGGRLRQARVRTATWWPGVSVSITYDTRIEGGTIGGRPEMVAVAGRIPEGSFLVESEGCRIGVWTLPNDPVLPGLAAAIDPRRARAVVRQLGGDGTGTTTRLRTYRPGKRAVVAVEGNRDRIFFKLTRPSAIGELHERHKTLPQSLPVPHSLGVDRALGILAMQALPGRTLHHVLEDPHGRLPAAADVVALAAELPEPTTPTETSSPLVRVEGLAEVLRVVAPGTADLVDIVVAGIGDEDVAPSVPSHGDYYESQLLVAEGRMVGMLDVDTYGWGRPGDDAATMLGHLAVWATLSRDPDRVNRYAGELLRHWDACLDPCDLRRRTAAVILGLATGPFRTQLHDWPAATERRVALAARWLASADLIRERRLTTATGPPHGGPAS